MPSDARRLCDLILYKTYADLKYEAQRTYIGVFWWLIEPLIFMAIFYLVFAVVLGRGTDDFVTFLLIGLTAWHWVQSTLTQAGSAIASNQGLLQQVHVPKFVFPSVLMLTSTAKFVVVLVILFAYLLWRGLDPSPHWLLVIPVFLNLFLFIAGSAFIIAAIAPMIPDIRILLDNLLRAVFFLSGIFYDIAALPDKLKFWMQLNPIAIIINDLRNVIMHGETPDWRYELAILVLACILLAMGIRFLRHFEYRYAKIAP